MKRTYMKPTMKVAEMEESDFICNSGWDTINPGQPNQPAGARRYYNEWDDEEDWEE